MENNNTPTQEKCKRAAFALIVLWFITLWSIGLQLRHSIKRQSAEAVTASDNLLQVKSDQVEDTSSRTYRGEVQYVSFEPWNGGWNNKRMSLESAILYAAITNRTVILPPKLKTASTRSAVLFEDFFDLQNLRKYVPVMTWAEFEPLIQNLPVSKNFERQEVDCPTLKYKSPIHWCRKYSEVRKRAKQITSPMLKSIFVITGSSSSQDCKDYRLNKDVVPWNFPEDYWIHFPQNLFGHYYNNFFFETVSERKHWNTFMKNAVQIRPDIRKVADSIISELGPEAYNAVHFRQGDFKGQFKNYVTTPDELVENLNTHIMDKSVLYLATDEKDDAVIRRISHSLRPVVIKRYSDFEITTQIPPDWIPVVEMLVCAGASHFTGSKLSTFSGYITRLRGHSTSSTLNKQLFFTDNKYSPDISLKEAEPYSWNGHGSGKLGDFRGVRVWWNREYPESWMFE